MKYKGMIYTRDRLSIWANLAKEKLVRLLCTRKNAQVATDLQQTCSNAVPTTCQQDVFALPVPSLLKSCQQALDRLLSSKDLLQVVPTTGYHPVIQQVVSNNLVAT
jgi:hypothetical protein